jgi:AraC-like DNA-binding protein
LLRWQSQSILRIGATLGVPEVLREMGYNPVKVISRAGLDARVFSNPDNRISLAARGHLLKRCAELTRCPHFGLMAGVYINLDSLGMVGLLARHAPDVGTALQWLCRYFHLHAEGVTIDVRVDGGTAIFSYRIHEPGMPGIKQTSDGAVAGILNILGELCGPDFKASEAWFAHERPDDAAPYRKIMRTHVEFGTDAYALVFSSSWLGRALPPSEQALVSLLQDKIAEQDRLTARSFPAQVQAVMRTALTFDQVTADRLAAMFDMHVRTFRRRLSEHGTSHQQLLDDTRLSFACQLLEEDRRSLPQIAELLGYAEMRSFIRAFKRWSGTTPTDWRRRRTIGR